MRSTLTALALAIAVAIGLAVPAASPAPVRADTAAAADGPKVVIIVGATHGETSKYRGYADDAYKEAIKHTKNVVKVYSPNATWSRVKSAVVGASIVIYFGHGNGWPSPYTNDAKYTTKDGFGLNASAGNGDGNTKYYGEPSVATLDLAPNAIVMLHHLCYASGNSEPGHAAPSVATARKRVDNYGAGFLRTNARAVLADGHRGPVEYLKAIFTTDQSIEQLWRTRSNANGNVSSFPSVRTPGMTAFTDPNTPTSGFYRSLVGDPGLMTRQITRGFSVPGRAAAKGVGAPLYANPPADGDTAAPTPASVLPANTRLRILETVAGSGDDAVFRIEGLDAPDIAGYAFARDLEPRDSWAPRVASTSGGGGKTYSAAKSGTHKLSGTLDEAATWRVTITRGGATVATKTGSGTSFGLTWDPVADGSGDGRYDYEIQATDGWANGPSSTTGTLTIDSTAPTGTAQLDGGAATAVVGVVRAGLGWQDASDVTKVRLSNTPTVGDDGLLADGTTIAAASSVPWTLAVGRGDRTVYAQFQDEAGNWSTVNSDTIAVAPPDTTYHALSPVRLLDTRSANPSGVTKLTSGKPMRFAVAGRGGVPDGAVAVTGNLTVTGSTAGGYVTLGPIVGPAPATSTINLPKGDTRANGVVVPLDRSGRLEAVFVGGSGTAQLILDVTGYFSADDGATYTAIKPARALDTRVAGGALGSGAPRAISIAGRTIAGVAIPADALAITGNLTVAGQTAKGYLALTPTSQPDPATSTLNFPKGDVRANNVTVPLGDGGRVWVVYKGSGTAHAILDVTGYFTADGDGARWVPLAPARVLDSRTGLGRDGAFRVDTPGSVTVRAKGGIGSDAVALTGNLTVTGQTRKGYASLTPAPVSAPATSTLNFPTGESRANGVTSRVDPATGKVSLVYKAGSGATTHLLLDVTGYYH